MNILLVEDHVALATISCSQLREIYDHEVAHAATGAGALDAMARVCPDLVLLDLHLPDMSGYEVARRIREHPGWDAVVVVAVTAFGNEVDPVRADEIGIDAHFRKPMDFDVLPTLRRSRAPRRNPDRNPA